MEFKEFRTIIDKIQAHYTNFNLSESSLKIWFESMQPFDADDVMKKFNDHLNSDWKTYEPKLHYLVNKLLTPEQKTKIGKNFLICPHCGSSYETPLDDVKFNECIEKCLRIKYLIKKSEQYGLNLADYFGTDNLKKLSLKEIDANYMSFIHAIYDLKDDHIAHRKIDDRELKILENLIKTDPGYYGHQQSLEFDAKLVQSQRM
jgi:hypothetical protein